MTRGSIALGANSTCQEDSISTSSQTWPFGGISADRHAGIPLRFVEQLAAGWGASI